MEVNRSAKDRTVAELKRQNGGFMSLMQKMERKYGRYAINNLMKYVIIMYAAGFLINMIDQRFYYMYLMLDIDMILKGQVWRLVTFIIQPPEGSNILFLFIALYLYFSIGTALERSWGTFRFNLYFLSGILFNILAVVIIYIVSYFVTGEGFSYPITLNYINQSLFLAFAVMFPDMQFLLFFIIPVKVKYLAYFYVVLLGIEIFNVVKVGAIYGFVDGVPMLFSSGFIVGFSVGMAILVALANFLIYFFSTRNYRRISPQEIRRKTEFKRRMREANQWDGQMRTGSDGKSVVTRHKCAICGRTEQDDEKLEFRFCSKCDGNYEYCTDHLFTHEHVKKK